MLGIPLVHNIHPSSTGTLQTPMRIIHNMDWKKHYQEHLCSADEAVLQSLKKGSHVVFGHASAVPEHFVRAMYDNREKLEDITVFHLLFFGEAMHLRPEMKPFVNARINFLCGSSRPAIREHRVDFVPCHFHEVPALFQQGFYPVDVAVVQLSKPNEEGYCSFGISCDYTKPAADAARIVVAEVNEQMPFIAGDNLIHVSKLDYIIETNSVLKEIVAPPANEIELQVGAHCASLIEDGDTLQLGIGGIPDAVLSLLGDRKDLGIHTEMFTDGVMHLMKKGVITGAKKTLHPGKVVTAFLFGSKDLYEFVKDNPTVECYPVDYTNDPYVIGKNDRMVSINSCIEMDLTGQIASESIGSNQFSGTGGQVDFFRGVKRSKGGFSIMAFPSTAKGGSESRIVPLLKEGAIVTTGRTDVDYVATEYGIVRLRGKSLVERAKLLVSIAHPKFRPMLEAAIEERFEA